MTDHDRSMSAPATTEPLRVAFHTLGCRLNQYDTESIKAALGERRALTVVDWQEEADLYLLNSCTVTAKADQECRRLARQVKRRHPQAQVVVAGCYAQNQPQVLHEVPEIDAVLGNTTKDDVERWLPAVLARGKSQERAQPLVLVESFARRSEFDGAPIDDFTGHSRAFVKVQDGCDLRCAYCAIWQARGPGRSRPLDGVLDQVRRLHTEGRYNELVIAGVHLGSWGRDLADRPGLCELLAAVCDEFAEVRLRLSSIHPDEITPELLALIDARPQLRPHLHVSLQSGSDDVLARMRRPYRRQDAVRAVAAAAALDSGFGLGADLIVGFPGETEAEFRQTVQMVEDLPFTYLHVFRFSPRPDTPAAVMDDPVPAEIISERSLILRDLAARKQNAFLSSLVGQRREAVIESTDRRDETLRFATTENYATVAVRSDLAAGSLVEVIVDEVAGGRATARVTRPIREVSQ